MTTIKDLYTFKGHSAQFWTELLNCAVNLAQAELCILLSKKKSGWKPLAQYPSLQKPSLNDYPEDKVAEFAENCLQHGQAILFATPPSEAHLFGLALHEIESHHPKVLIFQSQGLNEVQIQHKLSSLLVLANAPAIYQQQRSQRIEEQKRLDLAEVLELMLLLNQQEDFLAASMAVVNEIVSGYKCDKVSLGWQINGYIVLQCISHMEQFEPKMVIVKQLESVMEEAFDQDEEVYYPALDSKGPINRDHEIYAKNQHIDYMLTLPLRSAQQPLGAITCERNSSPFNEDEIRNLRILCDQVASRLAVLHKSNRNVISKAKDGLAKAFTSFLGVENTLAKLAGLSFIVLFLMALIIKLPYRIEAPFILRSKDVRLISAPFSGYIDQIKVDVGQQVEAGSLLMTLDNSDLVLEEAAALANQVRYLREEEMARAKNRLIEMKIAQAQAAQALAQLELIQYRLSRSQLHSPIDGILVEGDYSERIGTPVEKGEPLFKIARHEKMFAEIRVDEQYIQDIQPAQEGEIAFVSNPQMKYPFLVAQINPLSRADESGNSFIVRSEIFESTDSWWRPGMSGVTKITVGERSTLWIISHRTLNFLRLLIWW